MASPSRSVVPFVLVGLAISLLIGVVVSGFAASTPDALQRAIINSECRDATDKEACLVEQEGEPVLGIQPSFLSGYGVNWFSGLVGVLLTFAVGTGIVLLLRLGGGSSEHTSQRVR